MKARPTKLEKYESWEEGCSKDSVRNDLLIPYIAELIRESRPNRILDVGCLTGYVPRKIDELLEFRPYWTLLDCDKEAINFARAKARPEMQASFVCGDFLEDTCDELFDMVLLTFTLLEQAERSAVFQALRRRLHAGGSLVVALPDCLIDILATIEEDDGLELARSYLNSVVRMHKIDRFTNEPYPFLAERMVLVLERASNAGFVLTAIRRLQADDSAIILMVLDPRVENE